MNYNPLAQALNAELSANGCKVFDMLSAQGKAIFFPRKGILGQGAEAKGSEINATIGTALEDDGSPLVLDCVLKSLNLPKNSFLYAPSFGNPDLRKAWKELETVKNPTLKTKQFSNPVVTAALTHAISCAGALFLDAGDEIIIPDLYWDNYELVFENARGAKIKTFNTFKDGGFDTEAFKAALEAGKSDKKVVLLNFPNNPTGYTATEKEAVELAKILTECAARGNKVVALLDDAYFGLVYEEGVTKESLFSKIVDAHENLLAVNFRQFLDHFFLAIHSRYDIEKPVARRYIQRKLQIINRQRAEIEALKEAAQQTNEKLRRLSAEYTLMGKECEREHMREAAIRNYEKALEVYPEANDARRRLKKLKK